MAIYRLETGFIGRADSAIGRSVTAAAAYRAGEKLQDDRYETTHDYSRRTAGIAHTEIIAPENAPAWMTERESLWNGVEKVEKRKDSRLSREFILALPHELTPEERRELVMGFAREELAKLGMVVDISIHEPKTGLNHHAHLLCSTREIVNEGFGNKVREWDKDEQLIGWRQAWEKHENAALEKAGLDVRVSCLSLEEQGIARTPEPKKGVVAAALERQGVKSERGKAVRETRYGNSIMAAIRDVVTFGAVTEYQQFDGLSWWERMLDSTVEMAGAALDKLGALLRDESSGGSWVERVSASRERDREEPEMSLG